MTPTFDGKRWRIRVMQDGKSHSFSCSIPGAKGRKEVIRKYNEWLYNEGTGEKTFGRVCKEYLEDLICRNGKTSGSYFQAECYIRLYIAPKLASKKMCKITLREYQSLINEACGADNEPLSHKTLCNIRSILMSIIKFGYADYQCEMIRGELYIPKGREKNEKVILQKNDIARLFEPSDLFYINAFRLAVITGMRPGEIIGLKTSDIDWKNDCIRIRRAVNSRRYETEGKNRNAKRTIPIGQTARHILAETIKRNEDLNLRTDWIFCSPDGSVGKQHTLGKQWRRLREEKNFPEGVSLYCLRHTFVSMTKNVLSEGMLKSLLGHSESMDTYGTYAHEVSGENKKAAEVIDLTFKFAQDLPQEK